jgi:hypothetical protein
MSDFTMWLEEGYKHIITPEAADHLMYCFALCLSHQLAAWRKILFLITAFTIGHSITLVLVSINYLSFNKNLVEVAIPLTIAATCVSNIILGNTKQSIWWLYLGTLLFGFIHGMAYGVSDLNDLASNRANLIEMVLGFNLGVEIGQLVAIGWFLTLGYVIVHLMKIPFRYWQICLSSILFINALYIFFNSIT